MSNFPLTETKYGFRWGPAVIERLCSDERFGVIFTVFGVDGDKTRTGVDVRVSPKGRVIEIRDSDGTRWTKERSIR